jgi:hypothetical protein
MQPLRSISITETSKLLRVAPPLCPASVLSLLWGLHLSFSLHIGVTGSHVPHKSQNQGGTLTLVGSPLEFLPSHRGDRFPRSTQEPKSGSRHLYAGRRSGSKQVSPELILALGKPPVLTPSINFRHLINGSLSLGSLIHTCHDPKP